MGVMVCGGCLGATNRATASTKYRGMVQKSALKRPSAAPGSTASSSKWTPQGSKEIQSRAAPNDAFVSEVF